MSGRPSVGTVLVVTILLAFAVTGCATGGVPAGSGRTGGTDRPNGTATPSSTPLPEPSTTLSETSCHGTGYFEGLPVDAACWIEIAAADDTPIRVRYTISAQGWSAFIGTFKDVDEGQDPQRGTATGGDQPGSTSFVCVVAAGNRRIPSKVRVTNLQVRTPTSTARSARLWPAPTASRHGSVLAPWRWHEVDA